MVATIEEYADLEKYRVYSTDCLYLICCALGHNPGIRYIDSIRMREDDTNNDDRSCDDIVSERLQRFGIEVID